MSQDFFDVMPKKNVRLRRRREISHFIFPEAASCIFSRAFELRPCCTSAALLRSRKSSPGTADRRILFDGAPAAGAEPPPAACVACGRMFSGAERRPDRCRARAHPGRARAPPGKETHHSPAAARRHSDGCRLTTRAPAPSPLRCWTAPRLGSSLPFSASTDQDRRGLFRKNTGVGSSTDERNAHKKARHPFPHPAGRMCSAARRIERFARSGSIAGWPIFMTR